MKNREMKKLALLGLTTGILMTNQPGVEALTNENSINLDYVLAKPKCKAEGGCGGLTATRDTNDTFTVPEEEELETEEDLKDPLNFEPHKELA